MLMHHGTDSLIMNIYTAAALAFGKKLYMLDWFITYTEERSQSLKQNTQYNIITTRTPLLRHMLASEWPRAYYNEQQGNVLSHTDSILCEKTQTSFQNGDLKCLNDELRKQ